MFGPTITTCHKCGADLFIQLGVSFGMSGQDYGFCRECLGNLSALDFVQYVFEDQGYAWPPARIDDKETPDE